MLRSLFHHSSLLLLSLSAATAACHSNRSKEPDVGATGVAGAGAGTAGSANGASGTTGSGDAGAGNVPAGEAGSSAGTGGSGTVSPPQAPLSKFIVVDQFGYLPDSEKIAVVRDPQTGFDANDAFTPGANYSLIDAQTGAIALSAAPTPWNAGATDTSSGDKAWWFDFSKVTQPGTYYVLDTEQNVRSDLFEISETVYREVLKQAVRSFFYQRVGQAKDAKWAGAQWTDTASHVGPGQDHECRAFASKDDASSAKDLWGGWYD
ncbi:MAG TPA: cellulase N-terminal Ig-like domain-containing protein, partial [Polyangiaceae bacterium]|nr:cellulase N-terminal Ig-like domain-containing protein [Polyangiaceae bacterium]